TRRALARLRPPGSDDLCWADCAAAELVAKCQTATFLKQKTTLSYSDSPCSDSAFFNQPTGGSRACEFWVAALQHSIFGDGRIDVRCDPRGRRGCGLRMVNNRDATRSDLEDGNSRP